MNIGSMYQMKKEFCPLPLRSVLPVAVHVPLHIVNNYVKTRHVWSWGTNNTHTLSIGAQTEKIQVKIDGLSSQIIWSRGVSFVATDICKLMKTY